MKYLILFLFISCKPRIVDKYDYIIVHSGGKQILCDYRDDDGAFSRCKDSEGISYPHIFIHGNGVILIKDEK
jgi:hypothetical protein